MNDKKRVLESNLTYDEGLMLEGKTPFTGIAYTLDANGAVNSETAYREGLKWGPSQVWYAPGKLFQEGSYFMGTGHGSFREWYPSGELKEEAELELGFTLRRKHWDESGSQTEDFTLKETDKAYPRLQKFRELYKDDLEREAHAE